MYNLVRVVMREAARRQEVDVEWISFVEELRWLARAKPDGESPKLAVNAAPSSRYEPRTRKRRRKQFDMMNEPECVLRKGLLVEG